MLNIKQAIALISKVCPAWADAAVSCCEENDDYFYVSVVAESSLESDFPIGNFFRCAKSDGMVESHGTSPFYDQYDGCKPCREIAAPTDGAIRPLKRTA